MIKVRVPGVLLSRTRGQRVVESSGDTLDALFNRLSLEYSGLVDMVRRDGVLTRFVNVYVNGDDVRHLAGLETALAHGDEVMIMPAVAGG
jgi:molybdopterin synthase sulfur carrier subunit